jgi:hypothetical protein
MAKKIIVFGGTVVAILASPAKIYDAGKLQASTFTALGIGPAPDYKELKLL